MDKREFEGKKWQSGQRGQKILNPSDQELRTSAPPKLIYNVADNEAKSSSSLSDLLDLLPCCSGQVCERKK